LKYDASRGFKFIAYAVWWIRREILVAIESPDVDVINPIQDPAILQELCYNGSKSAALKLGQLYDKGDEENGIFRNPVKARRYFKLAGKKYEYEPEEEDPHEADYFLRGSAEELAAVKALVDELTQKYGDAFNEFGLYIPMNILMNTLVGSRYYDGNLLTMNTDDPECIVLHAEANTMEPLLYALRKAFPNLEIEMKETKLR
jgi:TPR repeat protein